MKHILVLGAGRSSGALIDYLFRNAAEQDWLVGVGDLNVSAAQEKVRDTSRGRAFAFNIEEDDGASDIIQWADIVISLLPAFFHPRVAIHCLRLNKHLLTASYVSDEMLGFDAQAKAQGLLFLNECGLDPGIDHMTAMQIIDKIKNNDGKVTSFESFTGGLIAPETDPGNPWRYKFTWNPRNVVMAGQGTAKFLEKGSFKYVPYQQLFSRVTSISVENAGEYEGYANRDSLKYLSTYGLTNVETMIRGTLRNKGFCEAWNIFVQLGLCDDSYVIENLAGMTHRDFILLFLPGISSDPESFITDRLAISKVATEKLRWSGLFSDEKIGMSAGTPAQVLEHILMKRWKLNSGDMDMIVMWHRFKYHRAGNDCGVEASLIIRGESADLTAMSRTVGLPLGIAAKLLITGKIASRGVQIPVTPEFYNPILKSLEDENIIMTEIERS